MTVMPMLSVKNLPVCASNHDLCQASRSYGIFWYMQSSVLLSMLFGELLYLGNSNILFNTHLCAGFTITLGVIILCIHIDKKAFSHVYREE